MRLAGTGRNPHFEVSVRHPRPITAALRAPLWLLAAPILLLRATPALAQFQRPKVGQFEVKGMDFRPDGAWRKIAAGVRANRHSLMRSGNMAALNGPAFGNVISGTYKVPVLLIDFSNSVGPFPANQYDSVLFAVNPANISRPYSTRSFYEELSNNLVHITGTVQGWFRADSVDSYYEQGCNAIFCSDPSPFYGLLVKTLQAADNGTFDWSQFDKDGDGVVDFVTFIHSDVDGACGTAHIWAHRFALSNFPGGTIYTTKTPWPGHPGQFITVDSYTIQSGRGGSTACASGPTDIMPIGIITHETGHAFGLPDLYDTGSPPGSEGIGEWGLMGSSGYTTALSPGRDEAWSVAELGWIAIDTLGSSKYVNLGPVQSTDTILYAPVPGTDEFFYFENRASLESDTAQMNPAFSRHKQPGLLLWHIDQGQVDAHGIDVDNSVNAVSPHGVELVQADGLRNLDLNPNTSAQSNRGDAGDPFPGSTVNRRFSYLTNPGALSNSGGQIGFILDSISDPDAVTKRITFHFVKQAASVVKSNPATGVFKVNGVGRTIFTDVVPQGSTVALDVTSPQVVSGGRSRLTWQSWSDGGAQTHTHTAGANPDTTIANFAIENRVLLTSIVGGGQVGASVAGTLATGIYVNAGTAVTLTATPDPGAVFAGWTGDTTAAGAVLVLPMTTRGYNVTATFTGAVAVAFADATAEILGTPTLSSAQKTYLDQLGNKNGLYDLGDFLALVKSTGGAMPPALAANLKAAQASKERN